MSGLNHLGSLLKNRPKARERAVYVLENLSVLVRSTVPPPSRARLRKGGLKEAYQLSRTPEIEKFDPSSRERRLEGSIYRKFHTGSRRLLDGVSRIVAFQVPLFSDIKKNDGWGYIDLLGEDASGYPVTFEVKISNGPKANSIEPPLRAVIESVAYMIALRENWPDFYPEWAAATGQSALPTPQKLTAVVLAPTQYWTCVANCRHCQDAMPIVARIVTALAAHNFSIRFASINAEDINKSGEWQIDAVATEVFLPPQ